MIYIPNVCGWKASTQVGETLKAANQYKKAA